MRAGKHSAAADRFVLFGDGIVDCALMECGCGCGRLYGEAPVGSAQQSSNPEDHIFDFGDIHRIVVVNEVLPGCSCQCGWRGPVLFGHLLHNPGGTAGLRDGFGEFGAVELAG